MGKGFAKTFRIVGLDWKVGSARFSLDFSGRYAIYGSLHFSLLCLPELTHSGMV